MYPSQPTEGDLPVTTGLPDDGTTLVNYREQYGYDAVGNLLEMRHRANNNDDVWRRRYSYATNSNRLVATSLPGEDLDDPEHYSCSYTHDAAGNMVQMPHLPTMEWDHAGRLIHVSRTVGGNTDETYFVYDADGQRVRKLTVRNGAVLKERVYLGSQFEVYREDLDENGDAQLERETVHILDDRKRVALIDTKTLENGVEVIEPVSLIRYQLDNHLGSATLELSDEAEVVFYEEYHPFGTSSYRARANSGVEVSERRYRYTSKERDEETGLYYHGARYYAAWLGRWTAADPAGLIDGPNLYAYVRDNPVNGLDSTGRACDPSMQSCLGMPMSQGPVPPDVTALDISGLAPLGYHGATGKRTAFQLETDEALVNPSTGNAQGFTAQQQDQLKEALKVSIGPESSLSSFVNKVVPWTLNVEMLVL